MNNDQIREVFLANGFTIKEGQTDLKPYVYDAAHALLEASRNTTGDQTEIVMQMSHRWAVACYNKALGRPFEDFDKIQKELRQLLSDTFTHSSDSNPSYGQTLARTPCQYAEDVSMPEYRCVQVCQYASQVQPRLKVEIRSYPESNGKRNWTALLLREEPLDGLVGTSGGITLARGEFWNIVAFEAERTKFLLGIRDTEPYILDYGDHIETPEQWKGERGRPASRRDK